MSDEETPEPEVTEDAAAPAEPEAEAPAPEPDAEPAVEEDTPAEEPVAEPRRGTRSAEEPAAEEPVAARSRRRGARRRGARAARSPRDDADDDEPETPRVKPEIPGMDLEVDLALAEDRPQYSEEFDPDAEVDEDDEEEEDAFSQPIADASIDLGADARYRATGKRKTAVARVILKPGTGAYVINGRTLEAYFPRATLQRTIRLPLETVAFEDKMDVVASMHGGGVSAQADALRHGISRALLEADPNLRGELKRRGFLTRDARAKERKKAGLKKARKRPQFSKR